MPAPDVFRDVQELLSREIGLDSGSIGAGAIARVVGRRMSATSCTTPEEYTRVLRREPAEGQMLINAMVVPETWFFRDGEPFRFLENLVRDEWAPGRQDRVLRILSIPCASGEEPYSIAMSLLAAGLPQDRYRIDAVDVSTELLALAKEGAYGLHSFRGVDPVVRDRFFYARGRRFVLREEVRVGIAFHHGNVLDPRSLDLSVPYHIVFCRNLMIYLHAEARLRVVETLDSLMSEDGLLFVGHSELFPMLMARFPIDPHRGSFARRKGSLFGTAQREPPDPKPEPPRVAPIPRPGPVPEIAVDSPSLAKAKQVTDAGRLAEAKRLADAGRLAEAEAVCREVLDRSRGRDAQAHFLLGVILGAARLGEKAEECFARALYLDSEHYDAMMHLSVLKARKGDAEGAELLRKRAERAARTNEEEVR
ncbi:MAG: CheR family methyltransferase [Acidobacteriota bacterium]